MKNAETIRVQRLSTESPKSHGLAGHLNIYVRDQDRAVTGHGAHFRVVAFLPDAQGLYCRVDHKNGPRMPTPREVLRAARRDQGVKGRWLLHTAAEHPDGKATDFHFARAVRRAEG